MVRTASLFSQLLGLFPRLEFEQNLYPPQAGEETARQRVLIATR